MNSEFAQISIAYPPRLHSLSRASSSRWLDVAAGIVAVLLHVIVLFVLLIPAFETRGGGHPQPQLQALLVSLLPDQPVAPVTPPAPIEPPQEMRPVTPLPAPNVVPKPAVHPTAAKPTAKPITSSSLNAPTSTDVSNEDQELDDVVGRIRDNWLEPPGVSSSFRCRLRLDYAAGGMITAVHFLQGCGGGPALDDSVKRAIWKTGLLDGKRDAGSLDIEFTP